MEWSADGAAWRAWDADKTLHGWDLGEGDGPRTVWVRYTDAEGNAQVYSDQVVLDTTPPRITDARISDGAVSLSFSEPVNRESLDRMATLSIEGRPVQGRWRHDAGGTGARFESDAPLPARVVLRVRAGLRDAAGNPMGVPFRRVLPAVGSGAVRPARLNAVSPDTLR